MRPQINNAPAWCGAAQLDVIFAHFRPVEHTVKSGHLIDPDFCHVQQLGDTVHGRKAQEAVVLLLSQVQQGDDSRLLVVWRVPVYDVLGALQVGLGGEGAGLYRTSANRSYLKQGRGSASTTCRCLHL